MKTYNFGIIGLGNIADIHTAAISSISNARLYGCYNRSPEKAKDFAEQHKCNFYTTLDELLSCNEIDVVNICTPSGSHYEPALKALEAGKHVIIEKPLEITLEKCDALIQAAKTNGVKLTCIFQSRFEEAVKEIKSAVEQGRFGTLISGDAIVKWYRSQEYYDSGAWRGTWELDGGGALMNQSIHAIDLLQWLMGPVQEVQALTATLGHERIEVEDTAAAVLRFKNGALGVIQGSTAMYPGFQKRIEISGTQGSVILEEDHLNTWSFMKEDDRDNQIRKKYGKKTDLHGGASDPKGVSVKNFQMQIEDFINAIENNQEPKVNGIEARKSVEIILGIYKSAKERKLVQFPL